MLVRELDERLGFSQLSEQHLADSRGKNTQLPLGGRRVKHARYYWLLLAASHLTRRLLGSVLRRIAALPSPAGEASRGSERIWGTGEAGEAKVSEESVGKAAVLGFWDSLSAAEKTLHSKRGWSVAGACC